MEIEQVPAAEWESWLGTNGAIVLDVREPHEWALGTLPGAIKISMASLPSAVGTLDPGSRVLVVCRSGNRSQHAAMFLKMSGFDSVANMAGGMKALGMQQ